MKAIKSVQLQRKSQIQMGETISIIFIFMVLMIFGSIFFLRFAKSNADLRNEEYLQQKAVETAQKASFLPEIQCSEDATPIEDCIDLLKLESAVYIMAKNELFYYDKFEFSSIRVVQIYPTESEFLIYENIPIDYKSIKTSYVPTSIYNPEKKIFNFGYIKVEVYSK